MIRKNVKWPLFNCILVNVVWRQLNCMIRFNVSMPTLNCMIIYNVAMALAYLYD